MQAHFSYDIKPLYITPNAIFRIYQKAILRFYTHVSPTILYAASVHPLNSLYYVVSFVMVRWRYLHNLNQKS